MSGSCWTPQAVERLWMAERRDDIRRELDALERAVREQCAREVEAITDLADERLALLSIEVAARLRAGGTDV